MFFYFLDHSSFTNLVLLTLRTLGHWHQHPIDVSVEGRRLLWRAYLLSDSVNFLNSWVPWYLFHLQFKTSHLSAITSKLELGDERDGSEDLNKESQLPGNHSTKHHTWESEGV